MSSVTKWIKEKTDEKNKQKNTFLNVKPNSRLYIEILNICQTYLVSELHNQYETCD